MQLLDLLIASEYWPVTQYPGVAVGSARALFKQKAIHPGWCYALTTGKMAACWHSHAISGHRCVLYRFQFAPSVVPLKLAGEQGRNERSEEGRKRTQQEGPEILNPSPKPDTPRH